MNPNSRIDEEPPERPYEQPLFSGLYRQVRGAAQTLDPGVLDTMMVRIFGAIEHTISALRVQDPPPRPLACEAGCNYCCSVQVQVLAPEVLYLAGYLKRTRRQEELAALSAALADFGDQVKDLTPDRRSAMKAPCPLLVDGLCSVYEARPIACRSANSTDAQRCQAVLDPDSSVGAVETYSHQVTVCRQATKALAAGMRDTGLAIAVLELTSALGVAIKHQNAFAAWHRGEPVFEVARAQEATD